MKVLIQVFLGSLILFLWTISDTSVDGQPATGVAGSAAGAGNNTTTTEANYDPGDEPTPVPVVETTEKPTPILAWSGSQTMASFESEGIECWNQSTLFRVIRSGESPENKKRTLEKYGCRVEWGLECLNITEPNSNPVQYRLACRCALQLGPSPAIQPAGDHAKSQCYIPAGKGYASECWDAYQHKKSTPFGAIGFPIPYGDPAGPGPDPPYLTDILDPDIHAGRSSIRYITWNSRYLSCVPHAECREGSKYIGKRCQCFKNATFYKSLGTCSDATNLFGLYFNYNVQFVAFFLILPFMYGEW